MSFNSQRKNIIITWVAWQFSEVPNFLLNVWRNYLTFASEFFSVPELLKTFFAPWRRYNWAYPKNFDVKEFLNSFISNSFSRVLGALMRTILIIMGVLFELLVLIIGATIFLIWMISPFMIIAGIIFLFIY